MHRCHRKLYRYTQGKSDFSHYYTYLPIYTDTAARDDFATNVL